MNGRSDENADGKQITTNTFNPNPEKAIEI